MWFVNRNKIRLLLLLFVCCSCTYAQHFELCDVSARRHEITNKLDKKIDAETWHIITTYRQKVDSMMGPVLGVSALYMDAKRPESLLSNLMADALLEASRQQGCVASFALCNMGGLRTPLPKGAVTWGDIQMVSPFENKFCIVMLKGDAVLELMAQIAAAGGEGVSGIKMQISSKDKTLIKVTVGGKPIVPDALYTVATLDYLAEGNDNMQALKKAVNKNVFSKNVRDVLADYVRQVTKEGKQITSKIEGRITIK